MTACRGCGAVGLVPVISFGRMPLVNAFVQPGREADERKYDLDVHFCEACSLVQLDPVVDPATLFETYTYLSSTSRTNAARLEALADAMVARFAIGPRTKVLEIGSNDGTLLERLQRATPAVLGVDPARNVAALATARGVPTVVDFFGARLAAELGRAHGAFDLVVALNVVAHTPHLLEMLEAVAGLLTPQGHFVVEVAHVLQTILRGEIDTIYHEHVTCFSLHALMRVSARAGLAVVDAEKIEAQGGSLRVVLRRAAVVGGAGVSARVGEVLREELAAGVTRAETYAAIEPLARQLRESVRAGVERLRRSHGAVVALGASARGVVLMNTCGLTAADIALVVDDTPFKQGKLVPGCHVPVSGWDGIAPGREVACLLLSWNYRQEVLGKLRARTPRARVLVPLPVVQEIGLEEVDLP